MNTVQTQQYQLSLNPNLPPLKAVRVVGEIENFALSLSITQCYSSPPHFQQEISFEFPLYDLGIVKSFSVNINDDESYGDVLLKSKVNSLYSETGHSYVFFLLSFLIDCFIAHLIHSSI